MLALATAAATPSFAVCTAPAVRPPSRSMLSFPGSAQLPEKAPAQSLPEHALAQPSLPEPVRQRSPAQGFARRELMPGIRQAEREGLLVDMYRRGASRDWRRGLLRLLFSRSSDGPLSPLSQLIERLCTSLLPVLFPLEYRAVQRWHAARANERALEEFSRAKNHLALILAGEKATLDGRVKSPASAFEKVRPHPIRTPPFATPAAGLAASGLVTKYMSRHDLPMTCP
mmetsp:Transcript_46565/g.151280  ORF Transcript_46565/g.151280 Transcript_46565/m.151280 type:complete len:228 (-) Transcript_46565:918-1601(-)